MCGVCPTSRLLLESLLSAGDLACCNGYACHTEELPFVFGTPACLTSTMRLFVCLNVFAAQGFAFSADELVLQASVMAYWGNFAWTGNPNGHGQAGATCHDA